LHGEELVLLASDSATLRGVASASINCKISICVVDKTPKVVNGLRLGRTVDSVPPAIPTVPLRLLVFLSRAFGGTLRVRNFTVFSFGTEAVPTKTVAIILQRKEIVLRTNGSA
jgi:hypothetical protein